MVTWKCCLWEKENSTYFVRWDKVEINCSWNKYYTIWLDKVGFSPLYCVKPTEPKRNHIHFPLGIFSRELRILMVLQNISLNKSGPLTYTALSVQNLGDPSMGQNILFLKSRFIFNRKMCKSGKDRQAWGLKELYYSLKTTSLKPVFWCFVLFGVLEAYTPLGSAPWDEASSCTVGDGQLRRQAGLQSDQVWEGELGAIDDLNIASLKNICALGAIKGLHRGAWVAQ